MKLSNCRNFFKQVCCTSSNFLFVFEYVGWKEGQQKKKDAAAKRKADDGGSKGGKKANAGGEGAEENKENDDEVQEVQDDDEIQEVPAWSPIQAIVWSLGDDSKYRHVRYTPRRFSKQI